ncbi:MAG: DUF4232 domain-containing protein [Caulobacterales bacterium]|nr:DUF4232 domain-containing protein [Caulobacterales bacterium]
MKPFHGLVLSLLVLAGCDRQPAQAPAAQPSAALSPPQTVAYACDQDRQAEASYGADGALALTVGDHTWPMIPADAVTGARWTGETLEWWVTVDGAQESAVLRRLNSQRVGEAVVARCVRPTDGGVLVPPPPVIPASETATRTDAEPDSAEAPCRVSGLSLRVASEEAAAGSRYHVLAVTNAGTSTCTLNGYATVNLIGQNGQPRSPFRMLQDPGPYYGASAAIVPVRLAPDASAYFDVVTTAVAGEVAGETEPCSGVVALRVAVPGDTGTAQVPVQINPCNQRARVTPFRPSEEAARGG